MKRSRLLGVMACLLALGAGLGEGAPASAQAKEYRIGAIMELSGPFSQWGAPVRDAIQLAVDNINAAG